MPKLDDLTGKRFGRLTVICRAENIGRQTMWACACDCGKHTTVMAVKLRSGNTKSCGCYRSELVSARNFKHGRGTAKNKTYNTWIHLKHRCFNSNDKQFCDYGGRGISVCDEWRNDFKTFYDWSMSHGYNDTLTIDRIDVNGNYEPSNCRWVTMKEQCRNKRNNRLLTFNGKTQCIVDWSNDLQIDRRTITKRIDVLGWTVEKALSTPVNRKKVV